MDNSLAEICAETLEELNEKVAWRISEGYKVSETVRERVIEQTNTKEIKMFFCRKVIHSDELSKRKG